MKIAYYVSNRTLFPPSPGDIAASQVVVAGIVEHLKDRHEITIYAAKGSKFEGVKIIDLDLPPYHFESNEILPGWNKNSALGCKQIYINQIVKDSKNFDIIHFHTEPPYLAMPFIGLCSTPLLFTSHCPFIESDSMIYEYYDGKINFSALSKAQVRPYPVKQEISIIPNGVNVEEFKYDEHGSDYYLFLGRIVEEKGARDFIELSAKMPNKKFVLAGSGDKAIIQLAIKQAEQYQNFSFAGYVDYKSDKWFKLLSRAKATVCPVKIVDSCPLVPIESMASGTPVIAYNMGALPEEVVDGETGLIVEYSPEKENIIELMTAIERMENLSEAAYIQLRINSRKRAEEYFSSTVMASKYEQLYENILLKK